jgi:hypothetical protein
MKSEERNGLLELSRRMFLGNAIGAGALLAQAPAEFAADKKRSHKPHRKERRDLFFNLSHEGYSGHEYHLLMGTRRLQLRELHASDASLARARRSNRFLCHVPDFQVTHVLENVETPADEVVLSYLIKDPNTTTGQWQMSGIFLTPPTSSYAYAYSRARQISRDVPLALSGKRRKYGLAAANSLQDLVEEQALLDTTDRAAAMVNLHPEMLSADPNSAAHIQTNYIQHEPATFQLSEVLGALGPAMPQTSPTSDNEPGWATLVPYTDSDGSPLINTKGKNAGLILYDPKWQPVLGSTYVSAAMKPALRNVKNDTTLGADVTNDPTSVPNGSLWTRKDGATSITSTPGTGLGSGNSKYTLTNITPSFGGYSCDVTTTISGDNAIVTLNFKNWYVRYLGLYAQFLKSDNKTVVPVSSLPPGISPGNPYSTPNNELLIGSLTPEFTLYGIPVQASSDSVTFTFPSSVASSARILASGLGVGSHTASDTEALGIVMTSLFNLAIPTTLLALTIGTQIDVFVRTLAIPFALLVAKELVTVVPDGSSSQVVSIFWRSVVKGALTPSLNLFVTGFLKFLAGAEVIDSLEDAIPIAGEILQAIGVIGTLAEIAETTCEVQASPWTYEYDLVGTYDLSLAILPDSSINGGGTFPASAATYKVTAVFDNGIPNVQTLSMPSTTVKTLPPVVFPGVPLGGNVTLTVGFYTLDNETAGHGTTGSIPNLPSTSPSITITNVQLPITSATVYHHKQKTSLDAQGNHLWICSAAPAAPTQPTACGPAPGNICNYRTITYSPALGDVGYGWQSYNTSGCSSGAGQLDLLASLPNTNSGANAQQQYAALPCALQGSAKLVYDPLGRPGSNYYIDTTNNVNIVRQVTLGPTRFSDPRNNEAWGKFNLPPDDILLHPSGAIITINTVLSRMESLKLPASSVSDAQAAINLQANLHGGLGSRPGLFSAPTVATITAEGVILIVESGNNRIHAVDASGNPVRHFTSQTEPYFLALAATAGNDTQYLDIAAEYSGLIYVLSFSNSVYRLDIYAPDATGTSPLSTTLGFNAAKVTVDYWRNVYSLNYEVLSVNGAIPPSGVTEPSVSQWIPTATAPCDLRTPPSTAHRR